MSSLGYDANLELPAVDEHLVLPDGGYELDDGEVVLVPPALEPHAICHSKLSTLLEAHVSEEFRVALDMLTRTSWHTDRAPDASVYPRARDPRTGGRQLEHLAFEVVSTESLTDAGRKAASLAGRGVRRVLAIDLTRVRVLEWAVGDGQWEELDGDASISDPTLVTPLPVRALLRETEADYAVGRALVIKRNRAIEEARQESRAEGLAEAILRVLVSRSLAVSELERTRILGECDPARLARWCDRAAICERAAELLAIE